MVARATSEPYASVRLDVINDARPKYDERDNDLTFWEACLLSRAGRKDEAIGALQRGVERSQWLPPGQLADTDLNAIRRLPDWGVIEQVCADIRFAETEGSATVPDHLWNGGSKASEVRGLQRDTSELPSVTFHSLVGLGHEYPSDLPEIVEDFLTTVGSA